LTPASNFAGTVTITAKANDGTVDSAAKTFTLTVSNVNDAPVVGTVADQSTNEDTAKTVTLSETDVDTSDSHTFSATSSSSYVTPSISGTTLTLTPAANFNGNSTITIKANDGTVDSAAKTFTLTVNAVNDVPVLASVANQTTVKNSAKTVTLSGTDVEGDSLTYSATTSASQITISVSSAVLTLTPDNNWTGTSTITAKVYDGAAYSATKTFTLTVNASNTAPVVGTVADQSTNEDTAKTVTLSGTDSDDDSLTYSATSAASQVTPSISGTTLTLTPAANWNGSSVITIKANDTIVDSAAKTFTLTVNAINDTPVLVSISNQTTAEDTAKTVPLSGTDVEGSSLTYSATSDESNVTPSISGATLTLTPSANWSGIATITAKVNDGTIDSATKTFTLTVNAVNDAPVVGSVSTQTTNEDTTKLVSLSETDADTGDSHTFSATSSNSSNVATSITGSTLALTPATNFNGNVTITIKANDGTVDSAAKTFTLTVNAVNDRPVLESISDQTTAEDTAKTVSLSGSDVEEDSLTYSARSDKSTITPSISGATLTLTPDANWSGTAQIVATVNDGTIDSYTKTFTLTVSAVNDAPVVGTVADQSTNEDTAKTVTLSETDVDTSDSHTFLATSSITTVTPNISGSTLTLTPDANWYGSASITIKANDGAVDSAAKTFTLTVNQVDDSVPLLLIRLIFNTAPFNAFQSNEAAWANKIFGSSDGQLNDWYAENSNDGFIVTKAAETSGTSNNGVVTATIDMAHPGDSAWNSNNDAVIKAAITAIDSTVNFAAFDTNSNGGISYDELQIMFIVAGGETATGHGNAGSVWAHKFQVNNSPPTHDGVSLMNGNYDGNYSAFGERQGGNSRSHDATIGVIAHELGHAALLLPDLYDTDSSTAGIGKFGIMGGGSWGYKPGDSYSGQTPSHMTAYSKIKAKFIAPTKITADGTYTANDINSSSHNVFKIESGTSNEYFLLQNRNAVGYDRALNRLNGTGTFAGGLLITHVSENVSVNSNEAHRLVDVEEANNAQNSAGNGSGNVGHYNGLFFSGNQSSFTDSTSPNSKRISGSASNVSITSIGSQSTAMNFTVDVP
jgi:M6 family metalloprotease-like protein